MHGMEGSRCGCEEDRCSTGVEEDGRDILLQDTAVCKIDESGHCFGGVDGIEKDAFQSGGIGQCLLTGRRGSSILVMV